MNHWLEKSKENLLPLSVASSFGEALKEWFFTGVVFDRGDEDIFCELCEHPDLASHFEIKNRHKHNILLVGSSCILRFQDIEILDKAGVAITDDNERKSALDKALRDKIIESSLESLRDLWRSDIQNRRKIAELGIAVKNGEALHPEDLLFLFDRMNQLNVEYLATRYKISLRSDNAKYQLAGMSDSEIKKIWPALSNQQKAKAREVNKRIVY
ncbi:hypothetical protein [Silvimonas amylolytica]|uniref:Uncharacterized protein n=1 Tax=Silvimonas amylolytica TaxID=449663 RepID=A0ABQ2PFU1_9NEIS|nr:hypothetical protein [Silvimonas amylolytica]GGP24188.1 hypothetical protein GCM10010971_00070 [Silvimonas amylolytica]